MTVALATSTPTSITEVLTRTSASPAAYSAMAAAFSPGGNWPWSSRSRKPDSSPAANSANVRRADAASRTSLSSIKGQTTYA